MILRSICTSLLLRAAAPKSLPMCFPEDPHHHLGGDELSPNKPSAVRGWLVSPALLSIHHPIHVLTASLKDVASIPMISLAADTQHQEISSEPHRPPELVCNILPSAVEGPRREIERCDKDKIKLCFALIARSLVKGEQSSCRGGAGSGARLSSAQPGRTGSGIFSS